MVCCKVNPNGLADALPLNLGNELILKESETLSNIRTARNTLRISCDRRNIRSYIQNTNSFNLGHHGGEREEKA